MAASQIQTWREDQPLVRVWLWNGDAIVARMPSGGTVAAPDLVAATPHFREKDRQRILELVRRLVEERVPFTTQNVINGCSRYLVWELEGTAAVPKLRRPASVSLSAHAGTAHAGIAFDGNGGDVAVRVSVRR